MKRLLENILLTATALWFSAWGADGPAMALAQDRQAGEQIDNLEPVTPENVKTVDADPALWLVQDEDTKIYLFGTVHVLKPGLGWFDEAVKTAFDKSDMLIMELPEDGDTDAAQIFGKYGIDQSGKTLRSKLSDEDRPVYEDALKKLGIPENAFDPLDPWAAGVTMQVLALTNAGYQPGSGAETILKSAAKLAKNQSWGWKPPNISWVYLMVCPKKRKSVS